MALQAVERSAVSSKLTSSSYVSPDDGFVTDMIKHWWQAPASAAAAADHHSAQASVGHPCSQQHSSVFVGQEHPQQHQHPHGDATQGHPQPQRPVEPFTVGHPQATGIDELTTKLQEDAALCPDSRSNFKAGLDTSQDIGANPSQIMEGISSERPTHSVQDHVATAAAAVADQSSDARTVPSHASSSHHVQTDAQSTPTLSSSFSCSVPGPGHGSSF